MNLSIQHRIVHLLLLITIVFQTMVTLASSSQVADKFDIRTQSGVIMQYHHVSDTTPASTTISPNLFAQHMAYLDHNDFQVLPLDELTKKLRAKQALPPKSVSITFDDAYLNIFTTAFPILKEHNYPFTVFVATELVGKRNYLSWDQLREMQANGALIANHGHQHLHLVRRIANETQVQWLARIKLDISEAELIIQNETGTNTKLFAYPYGEYNPEILKLLASMGYAGFGQQSGPAGFNHSPLLYPRFPFSGVYSSLSGLATKLHTLAMPVSIGLLNPILGPILNPEQATAPVLEIEFTDPNLSLVNLACYGPNGKMPLVAATNNKFTTQSNTPLPVGRSRYNCTLPSKLSGQFYWLSQIWLRKKPNGHWYKED